MISLCPHFVTLLFNRFPFHYDVSKLEQWIRKRLEQEESYLESGVSGYFFSFGFCEDPLPSLGICCLSFLDTDNTSVSGCL